MDISPADSIASQVINPARESQQLQREQDRNSRAQEVQANRSDDLSASQLDASREVSAGSQVASASENVERRYPASPDRVSLSGEALRASRDASERTEDGAVIDNETGELVPQRPEPEPQNRNAINAYASVQQLTGL